MENVKKIKRCLICLLILAVSNIASFVYGTQWSLTLPVLEKRSEQVSVNNKPEDINVTLNQKNQEEEAQEDIIDSLPIKIIE
jgi:glutathionyl-hydroquinone reductase